MNGVAMRRIGLRICKQGANHNRQNYGYWGGHHFIEKTRKMIELKIIFLIKIFIIF